MRDNVNIPGTPLAETEFLSIEEAWEEIKRFEESYGIFSKPSAIRHGQEMIDTETNKVYRWNALSGMWDYARKAKMLGITPGLVIYDEILSYLSDTGSETLGEADTP